MSLVLSLYRYLDEFRDDPQELWRHGLCQIASQFDVMYHTVQYVQNRHLDVDGAPLQNLNETRAK